MDRKFWKIGHRGAAGYEPENTMRSFKKALELGVDAIELDVRKAIDDCLPIIHDSTVNRTTDGTGLVSRFNFHWMSQLDAGRGERIPTLSQVLYAFAKRTIINIELKDEGIAGNVLERVRHYNAVERVIISAFDDSDNESGDSSNWVDLLWMKRKEPRLKIALLVEKEENLHRAINLSGAYEIYAINPPLALAKRPIFNFKHYLAEIHQCGILCFIWTANEPSDIQRLKDIGVDGAFSDYPDRL